MEDYKKKYETAIKQAKAELKTCESLDCDAARQIFRFFPELKKSEDEKVREMLLELAKNCGELNFKEVTREQTIAWLEKQGEQNVTLPKWKYKKDNTPLLRDSLILNKYECVAKSPSGAIVSDVWVIDYDELAKLPKEEFEKKDEQKSTDKVKPKFKVGDWIINSEGMLRHIVDVDKTGYQTDNGWLTHDDYENNFHLWTIQDAKDGDVLEFGDHGRIVVGIVSFVNNTTGKVDVVCLLEGNNFKVGNYYALDTVNPHPAIKEQRDHLLSKMQEAGYEWDVEKKELKKIEDELIPDDDLSVFESTLFTAFSYAWQQYLSGEEVNVKQWVKEYSKELLDAAKEELKPTWSEEDENMRIRTLGILGKCYIGEKPAEIEEELDWLKSLKERMKGE